MTQLRRLITSDIPFARDDAHRMLPAMIGCLVAFAGLLLAAALSLNHALDKQTRDVAGMIQIEVPSDAPAGIAEKVLNQLRHTSGITEISEVDHGEMETLLKPWLGSDFTIDSLPVPTLIEAKIKAKGESAAATIADIRKSLAQIDSSIRVGDHGPWVAQLATALNMLQSLILLITALLLACVVGMVVLVARTNLKLHFKTVGLLHMFGATDDYILRQFQWNGALLAAQGAAGGAIAAAIIFGIAVSLTGNIESPVIPEIHFTLRHAVLLLLLPIITAIVAFIATRLTVRSMLHNMH